MSDLKIKSYGSLAEYWFPHRPEYEALARFPIDQNMKPWPD
jgi:hypothetical protein